MVIDYEVVIYQVLIVLFPIFVYYLFFNEKNREHRKLNWKLTIMLLIIIVLTMSYPIKFSEGYIYDFRIIPFIISFVYGGTIPGLINVLILLTYRFIIGGNGFYVVLINYSISSIILIF